MGIGISRNGNFFFKIKSPVSYDKQWTCDIFKGKLCLYCKFVSLDKFRRYYIRIYIHDVGKKFLISHSKSRNSAPTSLKHSNNLCKPYSLVKFVNESIRSNIGVGRREEAFLLKHKTGYNSFINKYFENMSS